MSIRQIEYKTEAEALLNRPEISLQVLGRLHRYGVWSRGNTHPRGSLAEAAEPLLDANLMARILFYVGEDTDREVCRKALLVIGQWGGEECLAAPIRMLQSEKTDSETLFYCLSAIRMIGGPRAVAAIAQVLKSGKPDMQEAALNAIFDLATGGSASDIDSVADASPDEAVHALEPEIAAELSSALSQLSERKFEYRKEKGLLMFKPKAADQTNRVPPRQFSELYLPLVAGEPEGARSLPPETIAAEVQFDPPIPAQGPTGPMYIALLPIEDEYKGDVKETDISPLVYQTNHDTVMMILKAFSHTLPLGVGKIHVKARGVDGKPIDPVDNRALEVGGESLSFEFPISGPDRLAYPPQFILTEVK